MHEQYNGVPGAVTTTTLGGAMPTDVPAPSTFRPSPCQVYAQLAYAGPNENTPLTAHDLWAVGTGPDRSSSTGFFDPEQSAVYLADATGSYLVDAETPAQVTVMLTGIVGRVFEAAHAAGIGPDPVDITNALIDAIERAEVYS